jgi:CheY-like chemotaxis protein
MRILVIDDDDDVRTITRLSLGIVGGFDVVEAKDGPEGVEKALRQPPDLILLDVMMPSMDGPQTLAALRSHPSTAAIPVVFLTAKAMRSEVDLLTRLGATGVLSKPFDPMTLPDQVLGLTSGRSPSAASAPTLPCS